jgi:hypothetical protein
VILDILPGIYQTGSSMVFVEDSGKVLYMNSVGMWGGTHSEINFWEKLGCKFVEGRHLESDIVADSVVNFRETFIVFLYSDINEE